MKRTFCTLIRFQKKFATTQRQNLNCFLNLLFLSYFVCHLCEETERVACQQISDPATTMATPCQKETVN